MKKAFYFIPILLIAFTLPVQSQEKASGNGVRFFDGSWNEALKKSISEKKPIFLDISAPWCGYCKKLRKNTFTDNEVGKFFNSNFINVELNGEEGEGSRLAKQYNVSGYPSLFIIDSKGKIIISTAGYQPPKEFLQFGKSALNNSN